VCHCGTHSHRRQHSPPPIHTTTITNPHAVVDAQYARGVGDAIRAQPDRGTMWSRISVRASSRWRRFFTRSAWVTGIGFIPVVGPIVATLAHWIQVSPHAARPV
jgi:hypothetical protein